MKQRTLKFATIVAATLAGLLLSGGAVFAAQPPAEDEVLAADVGQVDVERVDADGAEAPAHPECVRVTGSRICRDAESVEGDGRTPNTAQNVTVYSRKELETTGQPTTAEALRQLDPRLR